MENNNTRNQNHVKNVFLKQINLTSWPENITCIDISRKKIIVLPENVKFPTVLVDLNISDNSLADVPNAVITLPNLKKLDISANNIKFFDAIPEFCHIIEELNLAKNKLMSPPHWVWSESPRRLSKLDLSWNINITTSIESNLLKHKTLVKEVKLYNCKLRNNLELLQTFSHTEELILGAPDYSVFFSNRFDQVPCFGLDECLEIQRLNLSNTLLYCVATNINIYKDLTELNLSFNNLNNLPNQLCILDKLEVLILSCNNIMYLPEDIVKLHSMICLRVDSNRLCVVPPNLSQLGCLRTLDLYNNNLYEYPVEIRGFEELDLAQNYCDEPDDEYYVKQMEKLRMNIGERCTGRKAEPISDKEEDLYSDTSTTDEEELIKYLSTNNSSQEAPPTRKTPPSSPEDWDSDDYWVPGFLHPKPRPTQPQWVYFIRRKMNEGNFCPMDLHQASVEEMVKYERLCNPKVWTVEEGQFDDCSDDDS